jgi:hypothetical protein
MIVGGHPTDHLHALIQTSVAEHLEHLALVARFHLQDCPEFLGKQRGDGRLVARHPRQVDLDPAAAGEGHFAQGHEQATVGPVVVREHQRRPAQA